MKREGVYSIIDSERDYQDFMEKTGTSHIVPDFPLSAGLLCIQKLLNDATQLWYSEKSPYPKTMEIMRKIAAVSVKMGEKYDMKLNDKLSQYSPTYIQQVINSK